MPLVGRNGKISLLRTNDDANHVWGGGNDVLTTEVIVQFDGTSAEAYGFDLKAGDLALPAKLAMLSVLRDAYIHGRTVNLAVDLDAGKKNGKLRRVNLQ
jgi:hypothetical protein